ncbi:MAG: hypothetical protein M0P97_01215 [Candidatus Moranbacteria bacterium]|jgi:hypothetical protein|nr:hypothetical protein [Candidatus Moranbacteria bacterium]
MSYFKKDLKKIDHVNQKIQDEFDSFLYENNLEGKFNSFLDVIGTKLTFMSDNTADVFMGKVISVRLKKHDWYKSKRAKKIMKREGEKNWQHYSSRIITDFGELTFKGAMEWTCHVDNKNIDGYVFFLNL